MADLSDTPTNGVGVDSEDEDAAKLRPVVIDQDVREMERRKRVEAIMSSKLFREELERVVSDSLKVSNILYSLHLVFFAKQLHIQLEF